MPPVSRDPWHSGLQLRVVDGPGLDGVTDLDQPRLAIGRSRGAPGERATGWVFLEDRSVSRQHAELVWDDDAYRLVHLSQTNLTWVNGDPVTDRRLVVGDVIKIGPIGKCLERAEREGVITSTQKADMLARVGSGQYRTQIVVVNESSSVAGQTLHVSPTMADGVLGAKAALAGNKVPEIIIHNLPPNTLVR